MISRFARACFLGGGAAGCVPSVGAEPSPSHAVGAPEAGAQSVPNEQQFASISAANRNTMHFEIIAVTYGGRYGVASKRRKTAIPC